MQLKKIKQVNLNTTYKQLDFALNRVFFKKEEQFVLHNDTAYVLAFCKDDITKIKLLEINANNEDVVIHSLHHYLKIEDEYTDSAFRNLRLLKHQNNLLVFVSKTKKDVRERDRILLFEDFNIDNPKTIYYTNELEPKQYPHFKEIQEYPMIENVGFSDEYIFPVLIGYGSTNDKDKHIALLEIDFKTLKANWLTQKQDEFIPYKKKKTIFDAVQYSNRKIQFFTKGNSYRYPRHGMKGPILVGEIDISQKKPYKTLYKCEHDKKSTKLFGRTAYFSSDQQYVIIKPYFPKHDPWGDGQTEKLFDLQYRELIDLELPRGFAKHSIIDKDGEYFLVIGKNSKKENLLTILHADDV